MMVNEWRLYTIISVYFDWWDCWRWWIVFPMAHGRNVGKHQSANPMFASQDHDFPIFSCVLSRSKTSWCILDHLGSSWITILRVVWCSETIDPSNMDLDSSGFFEWGRLTGNFSVSGNCQAARKWQTHIYNIYIYIYTHTLIFRYVLYMYNHSYYWN